MTNRRVTDGDIVSAEGAVVNKSAGVLLVTVTAIVTRMPFASVTTTLAEPSATAVTSRLVPATVALTAPVLLDCTL